MAFAPKLWASALRSRAFGGHAAETNMALKGPHIIVGLGNPGEEYARTRHNAGFCALDALAAELKVNYWKSQANAMVGEATYRGDHLLLIKPQTFMNLSGGAVKALAKKHGFSVDDVLVVHDELDLPAGTMRLKIGGGHGGHNGLRSLHASLGQDYARLRIGIGRPPGRMPANVYVLQQLKNAELTEFEVTVAEAAQMILKVAENGTIIAMNDCNRDPQATPGSKPASSCTLAAGSSTPPAVDEPEPSKASSRTAGPPQRPSRGEE